MPPQPNNVGLLSSCEILGVLRGYAGISAVWASEDYWAAQLACGLVVDFRGCVYHLVNCLQGEIERLELYYWAQPAPKPAKPLSLIEVSQIREGPNFAKSSF